MLRPKLAWWTETTTEAEDDSLVPARTDAGRGPWGRMATTPVVADTAGPKRLSALLMALRATTLPGTVVVGNAVNAFTLMICGAMRMAQAARWLADGGGADLAALCPVPILTLNLGGAPCPRASAPRNE